MLYVVIQVTGNTTDNYSDLSVKTTSNRDQQKVVLIHTQVIGIWSLTNTKVHPREPAKCGP